MNQLKQIHAYTLRNGTDFSWVLIVKLLEIPNIPYAHALFDLIPSPAFYLYNKLIKAYSSHGPYHHCLSLFNQMCLQGFSPNQHTFTYLFSACASLSSPRNAQMLHTHFIKSCFQFDIYALTTLVDMYAKLGLLASARQQFNEMRRRDVPTWNSMIAGHARCGDMEGALELFGLMPRRNVISWTTMISGYSQNGQYGKALEMFMAMEKQKGVKPNQVTIASVLPACANTGALEVGQRIECYARVNGYFKDMIVCNAILEMYSRCGLIDMAKRVFDEIGSRRDVWSWNSMIMGLAIHGKCNEALQLFHEMLREGMAPDDVTFVGVLLACTHGGKVEEGRKLFESMEHKFSITAKKEHYGCMVDLLGRAGELHDAYKLIKSMPMKPDAVVWGAMLGACSFSGNVELAERAAEYLFELEPWNPGNYVILSNIYAKAGQWDGVARLRMLMKGCQITKAAGYSFIEEGGQIHKFIVEDRSHPRSHEIYALLDEISIRLKLHGNPSHLDYASEQLCIME